MNAIVLFFISAFSIAGMVNDPKFELQFCYTTPEAVYKTKFQWKDLYKEMITLRHDKVIVGLKISRSPGRYQVSFGKLNPAEEAFKQVGEFVLDNTLVDDEAKYSGGGTDQFKIYMVPKDFSKEELAKVCPGEKVFELKRVE